MTARRIVKCEEQGAVTALMGAELMTQVWEEGAQDTQKKLKINCKLFRKSKHALLSCNQTSFPDSAATKLFRVPKKHKSKFGAPIIQDVFQNLTL